MSGDDDDLRFGDISNGAVDTGSPLVDRVIELAIAGLVMLVMIYVIWNVAMTLFF